MTLIKKSSFFGIITAIVQVVALISLSLLKTNISSEQFADYILALLACTILAAAISIKFDKLIPLANEFELSSIFNTCLASIFIGSFIVHPIFILLNVEYSWLGQIITIQIALVLILTALIQRETKHLRVLLGRFVQSFTFIILIVSTIQNLSFALALTYFAISQILHIIILISSPIVAKLFTNIKLNKTEIKSTAYKQDKYIKYVMPEAVLNMLAPNIPLLIIMQNFDDAIVADYAYIHRLISVPFANISQSLNYFIYPRLRKLTNQMIRQEFLKTIKFGIFLVSLFAFIIWYLGELEGIKELGILQHTSFVPIVFLFIGLNSIFNVFSGLHLYANLQIYSLLFGIFMLIGKSLLFFVYFENINILLLCTYFIDIFFVIVLNILCFKALK